MAEARLSDQYSKYVLKSQSSIKTGNEIFIMDRDKITIGYLEFSVGIKYELWQ